MKGSPLLRAFLLAGVLALVSLPLHQLTRRGEEAAEAAAVEVAAAGAHLDETKARMPLVLTFSQAAQRVELRHLGAVVWAKENPGASETVELNLPFPKQGLELGVSVVWPGENAAALRLRLTSPEGVEWDRTVWGDASVETIVPFP
jgi:hypothetical protein